MISIARVIAHKALLRVYRDQAFAERVLHAEFSRRDIASDDRALATQLTFGCLRHGRYLEFLLNQFAKHPIQKSPLEVRIALHIGAFELRFMRTPPHASVNEAVALVKRARPNAAGFANALMRKLSQCQNDKTWAEPDMNTEEGMGIRYSAPSWIVGEVVQQRGLEGAQAWLAAMAEAPPLDIRVRHEDGLLQALEAQEVRVEKPDFAPPGALRLWEAGSVGKLPGFAQGTFAIQDVGAQWVSVIADPAPASRVLEFCAAPGGKTAHLADCVGTDGEVVALELHKNKLQLIEDNLKRLEIQNARVAVADCTKSKSIDDALAHLEIPPDHHGFDTVVVDAPCSGLGTLRRNPEIRLRDKDPRARLSKLQRDILEQASNHVAASGVLVYAVCTLTRAEGGELIQSFLDAHDDFALDALPAGVPTMAEIKPPGAPKNADKMMQLWTDLHGCDGFFAARLKRKG